MLQSKMQSKHDKIKDMIEKGKLEDSRCNIEENEKNIENEENGSEVNTSKLTNKECLSKKDKKKLYNKQRKRNKNKTKNKNEIKSPNKLNENQNSNINTENIEKNKNIQSDKPIIKNIDISKINEINENEDKIIESVRDNNKHTNRLAKLGPIDQRKFILDANLKITIADLGNACWITNHFSPEIQTRQ